MNKPKEIETEELCSYGCGQKAKYFTQNGKYLCDTSYNKCPAIRKKNSEGVKRARKLNPDAFINSRRGKAFGPASKIWREQNREKYEEILQRKGDTYKKRVASGEIIPSFLGRKHSLETKQKISKAMQETNNGLIKTKWVKIYCPFRDKDVFVQGTWEFKYAHFLNEKKILWDRSKKYKFNYRLNEEDYEHSYFPDFFLPETSEFIEIKGFWWKSKDGRVDDKRKMEAVLQCNPELKITILQKKELKELGIKL